MLTTARGTATQRRGYISFAMPPSPVFQIAQLVQRKISCSPASIPRKSPWSGIDEISEQNAVTRFHFLSDWVGGMPCSVSYRKRVAAIG